MAWSYHLILVTSLTDLNFVIAAGGGGEQKEVQLRVSVLKN